jgi:hypothetical protein
MYALFAGKVYYPGGGMNDYRGTFPTKEDAMTRARQGEVYGEFTFHWEWYHIVYLPTMEIVERGML